MWISLRFLLSEVLFSSLIGVYPYLAWKQSLFFYYHLYMMFSPISPSFLHHLYLMIFLLNLAAGHTAYHIYAVIFISYIWCIYVLYHHLYLIIISRFADPRFHWFTLPSCYVYCFDYCCWYCYWYLARQQIRNFAAYAMYTIYVAAAWTIKQQLAMQW